MRYLEQFYEKSGSQFIVLYGQRGIGKTKLVREFAEGRPCFYYVCRDVSEREQQFQWGQELSEAGIVLAEFPTWRGLFAGSLQSALKDSTEKQVIVLDEFQYLMKGDSSFLGELISFAEEFSDMQELLVVLLSSSISWVEGGMIKKMGKAAHKLSGLLKIKPLNFFGLREAFPGFSAGQAFGLYSILGGIPGMWQCMSPAKSLKENVCETILSPRGPLFAGGSRILSEELRELSVYQTILSALASGHHKLNDIYEHTGFSRAKISVYLKNLMELEVIEKVFSYDTAGREHTQKGVYRICSRFVHFTFTYLYPNASRLESVSAETFYDKHIVPTFRSYMSDAFKEACRDYVLWEAAKGQFPFEIATVGEWAGKNGDIDIIVRGEAGETLLGACQCERVKFPYEDYEWLLFLAKQAKLKADHIWLFTDKEFDRTLIAEARVKDNLSLILF